jgi:hypothetical protein
MAAAHPLDPPQPLVAPTASLSADEPSDFLRGILETTLSLEGAGMLARSPERTALYGEDRAREIADLEAGRHPRALR